MKSGSSLYQFHASGATGVGTLVNSDNTAMSAQIETPCLPQIRCHPMYGMYELLTHCVTCGVTDVERHREKWGERMRSQKRKEKQRKKKELLPRVNLNSFIPFAHTCQAKSHITEAHFHFIANQWSMQYSWKLLLPGIDSPFGDCFILNPFRYSPLFF